MRTINKRPEPKSLTEYRAAGGGANYEDFQGKDELREQLVQEQRGLCCYCLSSIHPSRESMRIEHWHAQSDPRYKSEQLDYRNLLGACLGNEGKLNPHCDVSKGTSELSRNPAIPLHKVEDLIHFNGDGSIESPDPDFNKEIGTREASGLESK